MPRDARGLTPKQARFVEEYLLDLNATQAAIRAGYSPKWANRQAHNLIDDSRLAAAIAEKQAKTAEKLNIKREDLIRRLLEIADLDVSSIVNEHGNMLPVSEWPEAVRRSVAGLETIEERAGGAVVASVRKVRLESRGQQIERVGRLLGLFTDKLEISTPAENERVKALEAALAGEKGGKAPVEAVG